MADKKTVRERAYWLSGPQHNGNAQLVTIVNRAGRKYDIRDSFGYVHEGIAKAELDFNVNDELATFTFERPTG